jgi:ankyrin repeat protein
MNTRILFWFVVVCVGVFNGGCRGRDASDRERLIDLVASGDLPALRNALDRHPEYLNVKYERGRTLLQIAVVMKQPEVVEFLLERGVARDTWVGRNTALHHAAQYGPAKCVEVLVKYGWDVAAVNHLRETPLHFAAMNAYRPEIVSVLLKAGADPNAADLFGQIPLHAAAQCAIESSDVIGVLDMLISRGSDVNAVDKFGCTALDYALQCNHRAAGDFLKSKGGHAGPGLDPDKLAVLRSLFMQEDEATLRNYQMRYNTSSRLTYQIGLAKERPTVE